MQQLDLNDVERIVRLLADATNPATDATLAHCRRRLAEGLALLVGADAWLWSCTATINEPQKKDAMSVCVIDGGWESPEEQAGVYAFLTSADVNERVLSIPFQAMKEGRHVTLGNVEALPADQYEEFMAVWMKTGFESLILSVFPLTADCSSNIGFYRRCGKPSFTARDRSVVHAVIGNIDWLHNYGIDNPLQATAFELTPREKQTLLFLLEGFTHKEIAKSMGISQHTLNDYVKSVHQKFNVGSRAELQANIYLGRKRPGLK